MELRCNIFCSRKDVIHHLDECEMQTFGPGLRWMRLGCRWFVNLETSMGAGLNMDGVEMQIFRLGWVWDRTWIETRCTFWDLDRVRWDHDGVEMHVTWMEVRHYLDGGEARILGTEWKWDRNLGTWMEVRRYIDVGETRIELRYDLDWGEPWIYGPGWRRNGMWMVVRHDMDTENNVWTQLGVSRYMDVQESLDMDEAEEGHGCR